MKTCYATPLIRAIILAALTLLPGVAKATVCVLVPHFKDEYWLSVGYGLEQEADAAGLELWLREAGGYEAVDHQISQIADCVNMNADAILIGAVSSDHPGLLTAIAGAAQTVPVFGLVNELHSDALSGTVGVNWRDMGTAIGSALAAEYPPSSAPRRAVLISGPRESGWVEPLETGLRAALKESSVEIIAVYSADTGLREQFAAVTDAFDAHPGMDVLIGSAPAIEAAMGFLAAHPDRRQPVLAATYVTHSVRRGLKAGKIAFAPFDDPVAQGRMAIRLTIEHMGGSTGYQRVGPNIRLIRATEPSANALVLSPPDYFPKID